MSLPKACRRIQKEINMYKRSPAEFAPYIYVDETNLYNVYFLINGPKGSCYEGGEYVVLIHLQADYPMSPPDIKMLTPSGRFATNKSICTTFTNFHPESWCPTYTFNTIIASFISFMMDNDVTAVGSIKSTAEEKQQIAHESHAYNKNKRYDEWFRPTLL